MDPPPPFFLLISVFFLQNLVIDAFVKEHKVIYESFLCVRTCYNPHSNLRVVYGIQGLSMEY